MKEICFLWVTGTEIAAGLNMTITGIATGTGISVTRDMTGAATATMTANSRWVSSIFAKVLAANCANDANGPHAINAVGNDRNSVRPIRVIRAIRGSDLVAATQRCEGVRQAKRPVDRYTSRPLLYRSSGHRDQG